MVYINARFLTQHITGVQRFAIEISKRLKEKHGAHLRFIAPKNILHKELAEYLEVECVGKFSGHKWEQLELPFYIKKNDLLINFCNTAPLVHLNKISTIHDLAFFQDKAWYGKKFRLFYSFFIPKIIRSSKQVFTVSETVKHELMARFNLEDGFVKVINNAAENIGKEDGNIENAYSHERFFLFVGSRDPRKNLSRLCEAFSLIEDKTIKLKVVGGVSKNFGGSDHKTNTHIEFLGRMDDAHLNQLYQAAIAFVYPSLYEGFGIPPLEAMGNNCPVMLSDIPVFRELYGDAVMYFDPYDISAIRQAIERMNADDAIRSRLRSRSEKILHKFSWGKSSQEVYESIEVLSKKQK